VGRKKTVWKREERPAASMREIELSHVQMTIKKIHNNNRGKEGKRSGRNREKAPRVNPTIMGGKMNDKSDATETGAILMEGRRLTRVGHV